MNYFPTRMCIACRIRNSKDALIRIVKFENKLILNPQEYQEGRSYYICKNNECINKVINKKILNKVLHFDCGEEIYLNLKELNFGKD